MRFATAWLCGLAAAELAPSSTPEAKLRHEVQSLERALQTQNSSLLLVSNQLELNKDRALRAAAKSFGLEKQLATAQQAQREAQQRAQQAEDQAKHWQAQAEQAAKQ